ncbi:DNA cytosine methyltransferase [Iningainema tapete]|uniref:DNA (cytosine-5-)-methyltransferase n=1 Tax=Iningainema tapete BLCC-T55 TaxID=2748662 RepID=A0A8J7BZH1_9CYAN|nr:DNA cytosine methyltransferase [Iningainema tapete]MBD2777662.1 DNA cytosine methyltransferase [Iningainema tapete BLCC-T55]
MDNKANKPTVLDLFCGAGGMSLGFENAGCEILGGIDKNPHAIKTHHTNDKLQLYESEPKSEYQAKMRSKNNQSVGVMNHICRAHNEKDLAIFEMLPQGGKYKDLPESVKRYRDDIFDDKYKRLKWNEPSWTLTAHMQKDCLAYIHPTQTRSISVREAARLQSFPEHFVFDAPMTKMFELVGNSVPPLLVEAIALE